MPVQRFFINAGDNEAREVPKSKVHPGTDHQDVTRYLKCRGSDINDHLENTASEIGNIVQDHHCSAHWKVVDHVREVDKSECQKVMKNILGEVLALTIEHDCVSEFVKVIGKLEHIEVVHHAWQFLTRVVEEVEGSLGFSTDTYIQEITIFSKHNVVESRYAENVHCDFENSFPKHLSLCFSFFRTKRELFQRYNLNKVRFSNLF